MTLAAEYDAYYSQNPKKWESITHDQYIYNILEPYGPAATLLDVGCGNGHTLRFFAERWPGTKCTGVDLSAVALRLAKNKLPAGEFITMDWENTQISRRFERVLLVGVAEHFSAPQTGLANLCSVLTDEGIAYIEVPNCINYPASSQREGYRRIEIGSRQYEWHLFRPTWEGYIQDAGLEIVEAITGPDVYHEFVWLVKRK